MAKSTEQTAPARAYKEIKERLLSGRFRLRQRLDAQAIAADLGVSTTPVREALLRLAHERLVAFRPSHGFTVLLWSEAGLRDLYRWRGQLALLALETHAPVAQPTAAPGDDYAAQTRALLNRLLGGPSSELALAAANADDRLHVARLAELEMWPDVLNDLGPLRQALDEGEVAHINAALASYSAKRVNAAKDIRECAALLGLPSNGA